MTTNRIYKGRKTVAEALKEISNLSEIQFHPKVVKGAVHALKNIEIDDSISQLPQTKLEEERFAYFYNDRISQAYNQSYLEVILMKNHYEPHFKFMQILSINKFSAYNKQHGWTEGDKLLNEFAEILITNIKSGLVFRVFGDDFIILSEEKLNFFWIVEELDILMKEKDMSYKMQGVELENYTIETLSDIERNFLS
jgi:diguanylate cyclase (GGDEF)-like protein